jgi:hypothetical protein
MSSLDRSSAHPCRRAALASPTDTSGASDKSPVLAQHAEQGAFDREHFTWQRILCQNSRMFSCQGTGRRTVSLLRREVPKPTWTSSF